MNSTHKQRMKKKKENILEKLKEDSGMIKVSLSSISKKNRLDGEEE